MYTCVHVCGIYVYLSLQHLSFSIMRRLSSLGVFVKLPLLLSHLHPLQLKLSSEITKISIQAANKYEHVEVSLFMRFITQATSMDTTPNWTSK